jgi:4-hydroxy-tetrahydrodipicolinate synthase
MPFDLKKFRGIYPAAMTMFDADEKLDETATARHWEWLMAQGVDGLVIAGTSGEFIALETEERLRLFRLAQEVVRGRVPLIFGSGHYSTRRTIRTSLAAAELGADGLIVILPYFQRPPKPAVIQHYRDLRRAVDLPIMLYNNPANSACVDLNPREIAMLVEEDVLHMVKSTFETVVPVHELSAAVGDRMAIFYGSFLAAYQGLVSGAHGWISGLLNIAPGAAKAMHHAIARNDAAQGRRIWQQIFPLVQLYTHQRIGAVSDLALYRAILDHWGLQGGFSREPFYPLLPAQRETLARLLDEIGWSEPRAAASLAAIQPRDFAPQLAAATKGQTQEPTADER